MINGKPLKAITGYHINSLSHCVWWEYGDIGVKLKIPMTGLMYLNVFTPGWQDTVLDARPAKLKNDAGKLRDVSRGSCWAPCWPWTKVMTGLLFISHPAAFPPALIHDHIFILHSLGLLIQGLLRDWLKFWLAWISILVSKVGGTAAV